MTTATLNPTTADHDAPGVAALAHDAIGVLHVINGEHYAGAERVQDLLAEYLGGEGFRVGFACLKPGKFATARKAKGAPLAEVFMRGRCDLRAAGRLAGIVRRGGYRILHSHGPRSALVACLASRLARVPLVHHVHSPSSRDTTHWIRCRVNAAVERFALGQAQALITVSESLGRYVRERGFAAEKVNVVPNGVPARRLVPPRPEGKADWTLGVVALFRPRKGLEVLLRSLAMLRDRGLPVRLRAVGGFETPQYEAEIQALVQELRLGAAVNWVGFTDDVDAELAQVDTLVLPSLFGEGMPMVVLEAMAAGLPVIATAVEGIPEAIRSDVDGLLAEPNDPESLAAAIGRIVSGQVDWHLLRDNGIARHAARFSAAAMAAGVAAVYRRVLQLAY